MTKKCTIYISDLANTYFGMSPNAVPTTAGYIGAYCGKRFPDTKVNIFRTPEALLNAIKMEAPQILGFSWYDWNTSLTINTVQWAKELAPNAIVVVGGANVPENSDELLEILRDNHTIDFLVTGEGELAFSCIVERYLGDNRLESIKGDPIDNTAFINGAGELVVGKLGVRIGDLNSIPSPYLSGYLDSFLGMEEAIPVIQSMRGCPNRCAFCVAGRKSWSLLRSFELDRVKEEIFYIFKKAANRTIRFADENFGIMPQDLETAKVLRKLYDKHGYPSQVRVYTSFLVGDRVKEIVTLLKPLLIFDISLQSMSPHVLQAIRRKNISKEELDSLISWAQGRGLTTGTEILAALPEQTFSDLKSNLVELLSLHIDSIVVGNLALFRNIELNKPESRKKCGFKTYYSLMGRGLTVLEGKMSMESEETVLASNSITQEEMDWIRTFRLFWHICFFNGYYKEIIYCAMNYDIDIFDIYYELRENSNRRYPIINEMLSGYFEEILKNRFQEREALENYVKELLGNPEWEGTTQYDLVYIAKYIHENSLDAILNEMRDACFEASLKKHNMLTPEYVACITELCEVAKKVIITLNEDIRPTETITVHHDILKWAADNYSQPLQNYVTNEGLEIDLIVKNPSLYKELMEINKSVTGDLRYEKIFKDIRSNDIRRYIRYHQRQKDGQ